MSSVWSIQSWSSCIDCTNDVIGKNAKEELKIKKARSNFNRGVDWKTSSDHAKEVRKNDSPDGFARGKYKPLAPPIEKPSKKPSRVTPPPTQRNPLTRVHRQTDLSYGVIRSGIQGREEEKIN